MILLTENTAAENLFLENKRITKSSFESAVLQERAQLVDLCSSSKPFPLLSPPSIAPPRVQVFR